MDGSRVGVSTPAANFTVTSNVSTAILNNPAAGSSAVSAAVSFNPKGASHESTGKMFSDHFCVGISIICLILHCSILHDY